MEWIEVISNLSATGVIVVLFYYILTKTLPGMLDSFREEMAQEREHMTRTISSIREEAREERKAFQTAIDNLSDKFDARLEKQWTSYTLELKDQRDAITSLADKVDDIRDAA